MSTGEMLSVDPQKPLGEWGIARGLGGQHPQETRANRTQVITKDVIHQFPQLDNSSYKDILGYNKSFLRVKHGFLFPVLFPGWPTRAPGIPGGFWPFSFSWM